MQQIKTFIDWICIRNIKRDVAIAQYRELKRQIPLMYILLMVNTWAVAVTHINAAPPLENLLVAVCMSVLCLTRIGTWLHRRREVESFEQSVNALRKVLVFAFILAVVHVVWALNLDNYGDDLQRSQVAIFIAITVIGCTFCLAHLPQAGIIVSVVVLVPYVFHYLMQDEAIFTAIAFNIAAVCLAMQRVFLNMFREFKNLLESRQTLAAKQAESERLSLENRKLAHTCPLTGIPNRRFFFNELSEKLNNNEQFAVGLLDLDNFKPVNDTYGHKVGDLLLIEIAERLGAIENQHFIAARLGGDEFGFIFTGNMSEEELDNIGQRLCDRLSRPILLGENKLTVGCSCGIVVADAEANKSHTLFDRADRALYNSKSLRRGKVTIYSEDLEQKKRVEEQLEAALHSSDLKKELKVCFQPIMDLKQGHVLGYEALARWHNPELGRISPDVFIPLAEKAGMMKHMTVSLFLKALTEHKRIGDGKTLSFNLSAHDVTSKETIVELISICHAQNIQPENMTFELTETAVIDSLEDAEANLKMLRACGFKIALDDFGTGFSSLAYLHRLPIDKVKIDRSFISNLENKSTHGIVKSIIALCESMNLDCIVEGVETEEQAAILDKLGCRYFQGYLFAKPMFLEDVLEWNEKADWRELTYKVANNDGERLRA